MVDAAGPRAGPPPAGRERVGDLRGLGRRDVLGRLRGDRGRDRRPADRRPARGRRRLGRCDERASSRESPLRLRRPAARSSDGRGVRSAIPSTRTTTRRTSSPTRHRLPRTWRPDPFLRRARCRPRAPPTPNASPGRHRRRPPVSDSLANPDAATPDADTDVEPVSDPHAQSDPDPDRGGHPVAHAERDPRSDTVARPRIPRRPSSPRRSRPCAPWPTAPPRPSRAS